MVVHGSALKIAIFGATGFVGASVRKDLIKAGHFVSAVPAPRISSSRDDLWAKQVENLAVDVARSLRGCDVVINCSGNPSASESDGKALLAANAISASVVARASSRAAVPRLVHVSSAVVQGRRPVLDDSDEIEVFSPYAYSKAEGERLVRREYPGAVIYRPPSVHAPGRRVTVLTAKIAASPVSSVAAPGSQPTPQALIDNVASAISFLGTCALEPPLVVIHPWEGLSSAELMFLLGGKPPLILPRRIAKMVSRVLEQLGRFVPLVAANARRLEMLWFGQEQSTSWLTVAGWLPPCGLDDWKRLGAFSHEANP